MVGRAFVMIAFAQLMGAGAYEKRYRTCGMPCPGQPP